MNIIQNSKNCLWSSNCSVWECIHRQWNDSGTGLPTSNLAWQSQAGLDLLHTKKNRLPNWFGMFKWLGFQRNLLFKILIHSCLSRHLNIFKTKIPMYCILLVRCHYIDNSHLDLWNLDTICWIRCMLGSIKLPLYFDQNHLKCTI